MQCKTPLGGRHQNRQQQQQQKKRLNDNL
jgi:hypothetical protein